MGRFLFIHNINLFIIKTQRVTVGSIMTGINSFYLYSTFN